MSVKISISLMTHKIFRSIHRYFQSREISIMNTFRRKYLQFLFSMLSTWRKSEKIQFPFFYSNSRRIYHVVQKHYEAEEMISFTEKNHLKCFHKRQRNLFSREKEAENVICCAHNNNIKCQEMRTFSDVKLFPTDWN